MPSNFWWVFASYSVVWVALCFYVGLLFRKQGQVERDLRRLKDERQGV